MADIKIYRIEIISSGTAFTLGDVLEIFLDNTAVVDPSSPLSLETAGISVELNGVNYPSAGSDSLIFTPADVSIQKFNQNFCFSTSLVVHSFGLITWPYAYYYTLQNHYSCAVNPATCDLIVVGSPVILPASDETTADGQITVTATSTNTIQYNLGSDFAYGSGSTSNVFTSLIPGDYRIFLRDSKNCGLNILVTVPFTNVYGPVYRLEYDNVHGEGFRTKIDITKRGYVGDVEEIYGADNPLEILLRGEAETDKFKALLSSQANLNLTSRIDGFFSTLYTNDRNLYRVEFYKDTGSGYNKLWTGKVLPFIYQEQIQSPPYYITVTASDGLAELKKYFLIQKDGQKFTGTISLIKLVAYCLDKIGLDLNIRVACNMYADGMDTTDSDDPFDQAYVDYEAFYLAENQPNLEFVLRSILEPFNCRIVQWDNCWNIIRVEELVDSYDYREFDPIGDYDSNDDSSPVMDVDYPNSSGLMWEAFPNKELQKGFGTIKVKYELGLKKNIIDNGDFRLKSTYIPSLDLYSFLINTDGFTIVNGGYVMTTGYEKIDDGNVAFFISAGEEILSSTDGGEAYVQTKAYNVRMGTNNQLKINIRYKINRASVIFGTAVYQIQVPYVKIRVRVKYGSLYLQSDGTWHSVESTLDFFATVFNEYLESEIVASQPITGTPVPGMDFEIRVYHAYAYYSQFQSTTDLQNFPTYSGGELIPTGYKTELRDDFVLPSSIRYYVLTETTVSASGYDVIRPADYNAGTNPRQWVRQVTLPVGTINGANIFPFYLDRIKVTFLTGGKEPIDTIIRVATAESNNPDEQEKTLILGSYSTLIVTETNFSIDLGVFFPNITPGITSTTTNILSAELIYTGWLRDSSGVGYENWTRDGVSESDLLHAIWTQSYAYQYNRAWRLIRGNLVSNNSYFGLLNVLKDVNDSDRIYLPISLTLDDINNRVSGEFMELMVVGGGSSGSGTSAFSSAFSTAFS